MNIIVWFLSLIIFSWCYSTLLTCVINFKNRPELKISIIVYSIITGFLYAIAYYIIPKYFNDILTCSIISLILSSITVKKQ